MVLYPQPDAYQCALALYSVLYYLDIENLVGEERREREGGEDFFGFFVLCFVLVLVLVLVKQASGASHLVHSDARFLLTRSVLAFSLIGHTHGSLVRLVLSWNASTALSRWSS